MTDEKRIARDTIVSWSKVIWEYGVAEMLQRKSETRVLPAYEKLTPMDARSDAHPHAESAELMRASEVFFPLRALVAKRFHLAIGDLYGCDFRYALRLGCPRLALWLRKKHGKFNNSRDCPDELAGIMASAFFSKSLYTAKMAARMVTLTREDCKSATGSLRIEPSGDDDHSPVAAACRLATPEIVFWLATEMRLAKRDFVDRMPTAAPIDACFYSDDQLPVAKALVEKFKLSRMDFDPISRLRDSFVRAVLSGARNTAVWLVEKFHLAVNERMFRLSEFNALGAMERPQLVEYGFVNWWPHVHIADKTYDRAVGEKDDPDALEVILKAAVRGNAVKTAGVVLARIGGASRVSKITRKWLLDDFVKDFRASCYDDMKSWIRETFAGTTSAPPPKKRVRKGE